MPIKRKSKSINTFKKEIDYTKDLINGLIVSVGILQKLEPFEAMKEKAKEFKYDISFDKNRINSVYELGFIRLFAAFESFMYDLLLELYKRYPSSLPNDKKIEITTILKWKTASSVREFITDYIAIENSYDFTTWQKTLEKSFGIEIFESQKDSELWFYLNMYRNGLLHSGGKVNSKAIRDYYRFFGATDASLKLGKFVQTKMDFENEKVFNVATRLLERIILKIENKLAQP